MRYPASEKLEIIRLVEQSHLPVRRPLEKLGVPRVDGGPVETDPRKIWRLFAEHYHLFRGIKSHAFPGHHEAAFRLPCFGHIIKTKDHVL